MLLVYCVIAAVLVGYLTGGRLSNYLNSPLKLVFLPCLAFLIEAAFGRIGEWTGLSSEQWLPIAVCAEYLILAVFVWVNRNCRGVKLLGSATVVNFAAMAANGFRMPVSPMIYRYPSMAGFIDRIQSGDLAEYVLVGWDGPLWFLGDTIPLFDGLASVGDLLMAAALFLILLYLMKAKPAAEKASEIR